jgi:hypothetical protein
MHSCPEPVEDLSALLNYFDDLSAAYLSDASYLNHEREVRFPSPLQPPAGYTGLVGISYLSLEEDGVAAKIRNLREV